MKPNYYVSADMVNSVMEAVNPGAFDHVVNEQLAFDFVDELLESVNDETNYIRSGGIVLIPSCDGEGDDFYEILVDLHMVYNMMVRKGLL